MKKVTSEKRQQHLPFANNLGGKRSRIAAVVSSSCLFINMAAADVSDELLSMSLEDLLKVTIRSSTQTDENSHTVPSAVTLFTYQQIQRLGVDYLHELMNLVPGFQSFRQEESADEYYHSVRGHRSSTTSREVLVLIDGQRFNREFDNAMAVPMISLANVEKIEFIRGPGSAIYGSNAFSGVVSITTRSRANEIHVQLGADNLYSAQLLAAYESGQWVSEIYVNAFNDYEGNTNLLQDYATWDIVRADEGRSGYDVNLKLSNDHTRVNLVQMERRSDDFYVLETVSEENVTRNRFSNLRIEHNFSTGEIGHSLQARVFGSRYDTKVDDPFLARAWFEQKESGWEAKWQSSWRYSNASNLLFGFEYRAVDIEEVTYNSSLLGADLLYGEEERKIFGVYAQNQWSLSGQTELTVGARYDRYTDIGGAFSPRIGMVHSLTDRQTIKLLYGEAFRSPTTNETQINNLYGLLLFSGNPDLKPEKINTTEIVWLGVWKRYGLTLTGFYQVFEDAIYRKSVQSFDTFDNQSGDEASHGVELEFTLDATEHLRLRGQLSWFDNISNTDFQQADKLGSIELNYRIKRWNANIAAAYAGERKFIAWDSEETIDDYWELNGKVQYKSKQNMSFYLQVKNLLDEGYQTPPRRNDFTIPVPNRGREPSLGILWAF